MEFFMELPPPLRAFIAGLFTWGFTALGASGVFLAKRPGQRTLDVMLGFAGGVMVAASFWSLLAPAIEISEELGYPGWLPPVAGFLAGGGALRLLDMAMPHLHPAMAETAPDGPPSSLRRTTLLVLAITLHNIPEGLAVSMPLRREGLTRTRAFFYGQLSAIVEPVFAFAGALLVYAARSVLPFALAFAAGAMIFVVVEETVPESQASGNGDLATTGFLIGFAVMMALDVALG